MTRSLPLALIVVSTLALSGKTLAASDDAEPHLPMVLSAGSDRDTLNAEDRAIAEWLHNLIEHSLYQYVPREQDRPGIEAFYRARGFKPVWVRNGVPLPRVRAAIDFLQGLGADGLNPSDYPTPYFNGRSDYRLAADELMLTNSLLTFAHHAVAGRVDPARVAGTIQFDRTEPELSDVLAQLAEAADVRASLENLLPQQAEYKALKAALASERIEGSVPPAGSRAQSRIGRIDTIIDNMDRWRWLPRDLGTAYVMVNLPDYSLRVIDHGRTVWSTRIVVGRPGPSSTPLFSQVMTRIVVNPAAGATHPTAASPSSDTSSSRGAPGRIRFDIPNKFLVTQSGASDRGSPTKSERFHGRASMLVEDAEQYAQVLLSIVQPEDGFTVENIRGLYGGGEQGIPFKTPIPVHVTYQTAFTDDSGQLQIRPDIYGYDRRMTNLLRDDHGIADDPAQYNRGSASKSAVRSPARSPFSFPWD